MTIIFIVDVDDKPLSLSRVYAQTYNIMCLTPEYRPKAKSNNSHHNCIVTKTKSLIAHGKLNIHPWKKSHLFNKNPNLKSVKYGEIYSDTLSNPWKMSIFICLTTLFSSVAAIVSGSRYARSKYYFYRVRHTIMCQEMG